MELMPALWFLLRWREAVGEGAMAVRLVHEASHHYFLALKRLTDLHDGSDTTQYHSPIKERGRTVDPESMPRSSKVAG